MRRGHLRTRAALGELDGVALSVGVLMDPIGAIKIKKDSTFAMLLEAQRRRHGLAYCTQGDLALRGGEAWARLAPLTVRDDPAGWFELGPAVWQPMAHLDVFLARKDPPFDSQFLYDTLVMDRAEQAGVLVVNRPQALRDANEKVYALHFPSLCPATRVARNMDTLREFVEEVGTAVVKPLDGMGGRSIFRTFAGDPNLNVILETLTGEGRLLAMAQAYVAEAADGDKRILLIDGEAVPHALARIPQGTDFRGNMARGGKAVARPLSDGDRRICAEIGPELRRQRLMFVGIDVIGDRLTEVNVTSPTGIRELDTQCGTRIAALLFDRIEHERASR